MKPYRTLAILVVLALPAMGAQGSSRESELRVRALADMQKARDAALAKNLEAESRQAAEVQAEIERAKLEFPPDYRLVTELLPLERLNAETAGELIENELQTHYLYPGNVISKSVQDPPPTGFLKEIHERYFVDHKSNTLILTAIPRTHQKVGEILGRWEGVIRNREAEQPLGRYRIEVVLLQGGKAGETVEKASEMIELSFPVSGMLDELRVAVGAKVKKNELIAMLDVGEPFLEKEMAEARLKELDKQAKENNAEPPLDELHAARHDILVAEQEIKMGTLQAPAAGTIYAVPAHLREMVGVGQTIAVFVPDKKAQPAPESVVFTYDPKLAERYGIGEKDLKRFGIDGVALVGHGVAAMLAEDGEAGRVKMSLTDTYQCEFEYVQERGMYLIVRGRLVSSRRGSLLENTLFLRLGEQSVLGITNMREALILVVRLVPAV